MKIRTFTRRALSMVALSAFLAVGTIAADSKLSGEIVISGSDSAAVTVNGEAVKSGRTIFTDSVISTPANTNAVVSVKNVGKIKVGPSTSMKVNFSKDGITGDIQSGRVTVLNAKNTVDITAPNGKVAKLVEGATVVTRQDDDDDDDKNSWWLWALVFGGAGAAIAIFAASDNNRVDLGGGTTVVSPIV